MFQFYLTKKMRIVLLYCIVICFTLFLASCSKDDDLNPENNYSATENDLLTNANNAKYAKEWMQTAYKLAKAESINPPQAARFYAYCSIALYEGTVWAMPNTHKSLATQLNDLNQLPAPTLDASQYDYVTVANHLISLVTAQAFPKVMSETSSQMVSTLYQTQLNERKNALNNPTIINNSIQYAEQLATAINAWIASDNFTATRSLPYLAPICNGCWDGTTLNQTPLEPYWSQIRTLGIPQPTACNIPNPIPFGTETTSPCYVLAKEVLTVSKNLTENQKEIAYFWNDSPTNTGTPPGHWVAIATQLAEQEALPPAQAVEIYAQLCIALHDAFVSCWQSKYEYNVLRPITYIHNYIPNQGAWTSLITTPPFPEYPSGHSVASAAAAKVLTRLFGSNISFIDRTHQIFENNVNDASPRYYTSFESIANEAAISRLYGGIHYRVAIENGLQQGSCIGESLIQNIQLKK